jgi:orotate phosphoribosyltransferase
MTPAETQQLLESVGAIRRGHFQLSSGLHSPAYCQCARVLERPAETEKVARALAERFKGTKVDVVASPALGGIVLGYELARQLGARAVFVERGPDGYFALRRFELAPSEGVVVAEDVITTGGSTRETIEVVRQAGGEVVGVAAIMDRSGGAVEFGVPLHALLSQALATYPAADCPLCRESVPLEKPGSRPDLASLPRPPGSR